MRTISLITILSSTLERRREPRFFRARVSIGGGHPKEFQVR